MSGHDNDHGNLYVDQREEEAPRNPFRQRGFTAAAVLVALVVVLGVIITVLTIADDEPAPEGSQRPGDPVVTTEPTGNPDDPAASRCGLPGLETSGTLDEPPEDVTWQLVGTYALPSSEAAGPGVVEDSAARYCYAHTREGALLMASNALGWSEAKVESVLANSVASGPGYDVALAEWGEDDRDDELLRMQIVGFKLSAYTETSAVVELAMEMDSGQLVSAALELAWEQNDWRVRLAPDGTPFRGQALTNLAGYVPWQGV